MKNSLSRSRSWLSSSRKSRSRVKAGSAWPVKPSLQVPEKKASERCSKPRPASRRSMKLRPVPRDSSAEKISVATRSRWCASSTTSLAYAGRTGWAAPSSFTWVSAASARRRAWLTTTT